MRKKRAGVKALIKGQWILLGSINWLKKEGVRVEGGIVGSPHAPGGGWIHAGSLLISDEIKEDAARHKAIEATGCKTANNA